MKWIDDFNEVSANELNEILQNVVDNNNIDYISEDLSDQLFSTYIGHKVVIKLWNLFFTFCYALLVVYILSSEALAIPEWTRIIFSIAIIRTIPMTWTRNRDYFMESFSKSAIDLFKNNEDQWHKQ